MRIEFKHALVQDTAYESLLRATRQQQHRQIATALEERFAGAEASQPELLAHHFTQGEVWEKAFVYLLQSGEKARQAFANQEAIAFYTQTIEVSARITSALDETQLLPVYEGRGIVWLLLTQYDEAIADFEIMRQMARASGDQHKEGESLCHLAFVHSLKLSQKYIALGWALRGKIIAKLGDTDTAGTDLQRAFTLANQLQSPSLIYPIAYDLGKWHANTGKEREAAAMYGKSKATIEQMATAVEDETLRSKFLESALVQEIHERAARLGG